MLRRQFLIAAGSLAVGAACLPRHAPAARRLDFDNPTDSLYAIVKLRGDTRPARVLQWYTGVLSLLLPGSMPMPVASYQGIVRTDWAPLDDGSYSYRMFDLGCFGDLETGDLNGSLINPATGERVQPTLVEDGPLERVFSERGIYVAARGAPPKDARLSLPWERAGDYVSVTQSFGFEYDNPLPPARYPELSSTPKVVQRSQFTFRGLVSDLEDDTSRARGETIMLVVSTIHPWLKMGRYSGFQQIQTVAQKIDNLDHVSPAYLRFLDHHRPDFLSAETPFIGAGNSFERYRRDRIEG